MSKQRAQWSGHLGFILAAAGSAIGLGNLWKFPYITYENNGGAFVLVYLAAIAMVGVPIMVAEVLIGRKSQRNAVGAFRVLAQGKPGGRAWQGVGILGVMTGFIILSYYSVIAGWTLRYILMAVSGELSTLAHHPEALQSFFGEFLANPYQQILCHTLFMGATIGVVFFGVGRGIERTAKILMPVLLSILVMLVIYSFWTPGFKEAIGFLFRPNFSDLTTGSVLEALGHRLTVFREDLRSRAEMTPLLAFQTRLRVPRVRSPDETFRSRGRSRTRDGGRYDAPGTMSRWRRVFSLSTPRPRSDRHCVVNRRWRRQPPESPHRITLRAF